MTDLPTTTQAMKYIILYQTYDLLDKVVELDASRTELIRVARDIAKDCRRITVYSDAKDFGTDEYRLLGSRGVVGKGIKWYWQLLLLRKELEYDK